MPDAKRDDFLRKMIAEGTSDDDIIATLKVYDAQSPKQALPTRPVSPEDFATTTLPYVGKNMPGDTFAEKLRNAASALGGEAVGALKGAAHSALGVGQMAINSGVIPGLTPSPFSNPIIQKAEEDTAYGTDPAERFGGYLETAAELAVPAMDVGRAGIALAKSAPTLSSAALNAAEYLPVVGSTIHKARGLSKVLGVILDNTVQAAKAGPTMGEVGTLVKDASPKLSDELAAALADLRTPEPPARITTPPEPKLPAGYTPRSIVPKPKAAPKAAPEPPPEAAPEPPRSRAYFLKPQAVIDAEKAAAARVAQSASAGGQRAYFLKPVEQVAAETAPRASVTPTGEINVSDLPASWRPRTEQNIFPAKSAASKTQTALMQDEIAAIQNELKAQGFSTGQAIALVSKNKMLPVEVRTQLLKMLSKTGVAR